MYASRRWPRIKKVSIFDNADGVSVVTDMGVSEDPRDEGAE